ncbi:transcriptional repressor NrdR [Candidatus Woesearchaeota archaeon]|nr:transcriptional repressor NrdR [Candidatus Woesearchaeota archaeon]
MKCPFCSHEGTKVVDSRENDDSTRRRRECLNCEKRFTTHERVEEVPLYIIKKDARRELFSKEKLKKGVIRACEKRPVSYEAIDHVVEKIAAKLRAMRSTEIQSKVVGEEVMKHLKKMDKIAYIRFASVYREFTDVKDFKKEIQTL